MKCPDFEILMLMLDGELPEDQLKEVTDHVESCRDCTRIIRSQEHIETSWRDNYKSPGDAQFRRFEQQLFEKMHHHSSRKWWTVIPIAASIAAVLLGVKLIISEKPSIESPPGYTMHATEENQVVAGRSEQMEDTFSPDIPEAESGVDAMMSETPLETQVDQTSDISVETDAHSRMSTVGYTGSDTDREISEPPSGSELEMLPDAFGTAQGGNGLLGASVTGEEIEESLSASAGSGGGVLHEDHRIFYGDLTSPSESVSSELEQDASEVETVLSLDLDTAGLETVSSVPASSVDNRHAGAGEGQIDDSIMSVDEAPVLWRDSAKYLCVELVFDSDGIPDSMTALVLDSLIPEWYLYIPFMFRDTTLIIQRDDIYEYLVNVNSTPACENE